MGQWKARTFRPTDFAALEKIDKLGVRGGRHWTASYFNHKLAVQETQCVVVTEMRSDLPIGFVVYETKRGRAEILRLGVRADRRRLGIGRWLLQHFERRLLPAAEYTRVCWWVPVSRLDLCRFLRACQWQCVREIDDSNHDRDRHYRFVYRMDGNEQVLPLRKPG